MARPPYNNPECIGQMRRLRNKHRGRRKSYSEIARILNAKSEYPSPAGRYGGWEATTIKNILDRDRKPKKRKRVQRRGIFGDNYLNVTQATKLFIYCNTVIYGPHGDKKPSFRSVRSARLIMIFLLTGIRREEICKLRVIDTPKIHGKHEIIVRGKGNTLAPVRVTPYVEKLLNEQCGVRKSGFLFVNEAGNNYQRQSINTILRGVGRKLKLSNLRPHVLRHTYASILFWCGCNVAFVRDQLRHSSIAITDIYTNTIIDYYSDDLPDDVKSFLQAINPLHSKNIYTL